MIGVPDNYPTSVNMIVRTSKVRRGDVIVQQVPNKENPYREVRLTAVPEHGEILYLGVWVPVKYFTGEDQQGRTVKLTGTDYQTWQIVRSAQLFMR